LEESGDVSLKNDCALISHFHGYNLSFLKFYHFLLKDELWLNQNSFRGTLPNTILYLTKLEVLNIQRTNLNDSIILTDPRYCSNFPWMQQLILDCWDTDENKIVASIADSANSTTEIKCPCCVCSNEREQY
jgi:hypothetical protein